MFNEGLPGTLGEHENTAKNDWGKRNREEEENMVKFCKEAREQSENYERNTRTPLNEALLNEKNTSELTEIYQLVSSVPSLISLTSHCSFQQTVQPLNSTLRTHHTIEGHHQFPPVLSLNSSE